MAPDAAGRGVVSPSLPNVHTTLNKLSCNFRMIPLCFASLHLLSLILFINGFLLGRVDSPERSKFTGNPAVQNKLVWLIIDGLRYDAAISDERYPCRLSRRGRCGQLQYLNGLLAQEQVSRAFRFIADPPTTTSQRIRCLTTGGLPRFFDVGNSFTPGHVEEDNIIDQLHASGKKLAILGDVTWSHLFPSQFHISHTYPCFDIKDLHTVDDGVSQHLPSLLNTPGNWDVLVAHYLGVDHVGHSHGSDSGEMVAKLQQMDKSIEQVVETMARHAGPGGQYEKTVVLVSGDHGQTLHGAHGGGSPEEVDTALVAINLAAVYRFHTMGVRKSTEPTQTSRSNDADTMCGSKMADADANAGSAPHAFRHCHSSQHSTGLLPRPPHVWQSAACRSNCSCGADANQCAADMPQVDLAPTLAALLGVPVPSGNIGKICPELWGLYASDSLQSSFENAGSSRQREVTRHEMDDHAVDILLASALRENADQVHAYLQQGASHANMMVSGLQKLKKKYEGLPSNFKQGALQEVDAMVLRYLAFLESAASYAREHWTQFNHVSMVAGLLFFACSLSAQTASVFVPNKPVSGVIDKVRKNGVEFLNILRRWPAACLTVPVWFVLLISAHVMGIFSFFFLLSEGSNISMIVAAMFCTLTLAVFSSSATIAKDAPAPMIQSSRRFVSVSYKQACRKLRWRVVLLALLAFGSNAAMSFAGLASHSGRAFWNRLTLEPEVNIQPAGAAGLYWAAKALCLPQFLSFAMGLFPASKLIFISEAAWRSIAQHALLCILPIVVLAAMYMQLLVENHKKTNIKPPMLQLGLLGMAFMSVGTYHQVEYLQRIGLVEKDCTAMTFLQPTISAGWQDLKNLASSCWWGSAGQFKTISSLFLHQLCYIPLNWIFHNVSRMPVRLLLPQVTYALVGISLIAFAAAHAFRCIMVFLARTPKNGSDCASVNANSRLTAIMYFCLRLQGPLLVLILQVSSSIMPLLLLCGALQLWAGKQLLCLRGQQIRQDADKVAMEAAALLAMQQMQIFFCTGQVCEFAGLQHLAGFVGYDDFHLLRSGILLVFHTFGPMIMVVLLVPYIMHSLLSNASHRRTSRANKAIQSTGNCNLQVVPAWHRGLQVFLLIRSCTAFAATLSAGIQRRHLYIWALFAPRFAYETCFLVGSDILMGLIAAFG